MISLINKLELEHGVATYINGVALNEVRYIMICCCLPPERQGGGMSYLEITIIHVTSFRSQIVLDEILQRTVICPSLLISPLCHYRICHRLCFPSFLSIRFELTVTRRMVRTKLEILV